MKLETGVISFTKGKFLSIILSRYLINKVFIYLLMLATLILAAYYQKERYIAHLAIIGIVGFICFEIFKYWNYVNSPEIKDNYCNYSLLITDVGITVNSSESEQKIKWKEMAKSKPFVGAIILYTFNQELILVTKSSFPNNKEWHEFKAYIKGKLL